MADKPVGNMKFGVGIDGLDETLNTLDKLNRAIKVSESAMRANISTYDKAGLSVEELELKQNDLVKALDLQSKKIDLLKKRRSDYIDTYGAESKQVASVTDQINKASVKYNKYSKEVDSTKQAYILASSGVDKYTKALRDNERSMDSEVKALEQAGDEVGAFEARQKGLKKQAELTDKAIDAQRRAVDLMGKEFGESARETKQAEEKLDELGRQAKVTDKQLDALSGSVKRGGKSLDGFSRAGSAMSSFVGNTLANAFSRVTSFIGDLVSEAVSASDSLSKFSKTMDFAGFGAEAIEKSRKVMKSYADETVYGLEEVLNTTAQLASNGIENYTELTQAAGNLNAVAGGNAETFKSVAMMLTQTAGAGKLTTENWNQLADAIPGASGLLQEAMLKNGAYTGNFRDAMVAGQITSDEFNQAITQLGMNPGAVEAAKSTDTLSGAWEQMKSTIVNGLTAIIEKIGVENITGFINGITKGVEDSIPKIEAFVGKLSSFTNWIVENKETLIWLVGVIGGIVLAIKGLAVASAIFGAISIVAGGLVVALGALVGALVVAYTKSETFRNIVNGVFKAIWNFVKPIIDSLIQGFKDWWTIMNWLWGKISGWATNVWTKFSEVKTNITRAVSETWTGIKNSFSGGIDTVINWMKDLPNKLATAFSNGKNTVTNAFKGVFNAALKAIGKPVNGIIKGASWVLEKLGAEPLKEWDVPQYATGTPTSGHPGGPMMVNDGRGAEAVITPSGKAFIPKGRNVVMNAPKGTHVLTAEETAYMTGNKAPKYRYKKGTNFFGNLWNNVKGFAGNVGNKLKDSVGDVWDFISNPAELAKKVLGGLGVLDGLVKYPLDVGKGILSKATTALTDKIKGLFSSGNLDTSIGTNGVYKYLADVAKDVMANFPGFVATSGYRPGDPYSHGKRNAIDIALPGVTGGSPRYLEAANYAFEKFASKVGYVITNGKVRDRSGQSGQGTSGQWVPWPDGDHYDHVHINGIKNPQDKQISGENFGGSGVERWRGIATQALRMTGQYSASNLNALLNQMRTESNGDPNAINNWDINAKNGTPSKGLLQVIDPTFRAYAMPGHNSNIFDPLSNILASIRYALSRYGTHIVA